MLCYIGTCSNALLSSSVSVTKLNVFLLTSTINLCINHYDFVPFTEQHRKFSNFLSGIEPEQEKVSLDTEFLIHWALQFSLM